MVCIEIAKDHNIVTRDVEVVELLSNVVSRDCPLAHAASHSHSATTHDPCFIPNSPTASSAHNITDPTHPATAATATFCQDIDDD